MLIARRFHLAFSAVALLAALPLSGCVSDQGVDLGYETVAVELTDADVEGILGRGVAAAAVEASLLRRDVTGDPQNCRMHVIVVGRDGGVIGRRSMADAWGGSVSIAKSKAYTAAAFSSHENALTTRSLGALTQPGGALWNIGNSNYEAGPGLIEFPGGVPLYKDGRLVGAVGVSGDGVEQDENVAEAAAEGFEPPLAIRIDTVTDGAVPYTQ